MKKVCLWISVLLWAALIFGFSAQSKEASGEISSGISRKLVSAVTDMDENSRQSPVREERIEFSRHMKKTTMLVRKSAHVLLFLVLGALVLQLVGCYITKKWKILAFTLLFCLIYAVGDEIHQAFVPGRACLSLDVFIDFCGSLAGCLIMTLAGKIRKGV